MDAAGTSPARERVYESTRTQCARKRSPRGRMQQARRADVVEDRVENRRSLRWSDAGDDTLFDVCCACPFLVTLSLSYSPVSKGGSAMVQQMSTSAPHLPLDNQFTAAAEAWNAALSTARADRDAQSYRQVVALLAEQFKPITTLRALLRLAVAPDPALLRRVVDLCHLTGVALDPRVAFHAACALRMCQLQDGALA